MTLLFANAATKDWRARLLTAGGSPRAACWMQARSLSKKRVFLVEVSDSVPVAEDDLDATDPDRGARTVVIVGDWQKLPERPGSESAPCVAPASARLQLTWAAGAVGRNECDVLGEGEGKPRRAIVRLADFPEENRLRLSRRGR